MRKQSQFNCPWLHGFCNTPYPLPLNKVSFNLSWDHLRTSLFGKKHCCVTQGIGMVMNPKNILFHNFAHMTHAYSLALLLTLTFHLCGGLHPTATSTPLAINPTFFVFLLHPMMYNLYYRAQLKKQ